MVRFRMAQESERMVESRVVKIVCGGSSSEVTRRFLTWLFLVALPNVSTHMQIEAATRVCPPAETTGRLVATCPFCQCMDAYDWANTQSEDGAHYQVRVCSACHTAFLWPQPTEAQLNQAYAAPYYGEGVAKFNPVIERLRGTFAGLRVKGLAGRLPAAAKILDVGCGDGRLLMAFHKAGFRELHGIELPGAAAERTARIPEIHLHVGTVDSIELPPASFDLITLVHVYEHLSAPRETLDQFARLVKLGGRLFLSFPNIHSWQASFSKGRWFHLDPPRHLNLVPPQAVIFHLQTMGFELVAERHLCLEQNIYGWIQSVLNLCDARRNFLYERLKRNRSYLPDRGVGSLALHTAFGALLLIPALVADGVSALVRRGATVELMFEKSTTR